MAFLPTNASQVQQFAVALYGIQVGTATMAQVNNDILAVGGLNKALNAYYAASFGSSTTAAVAASVAANLGLTGTAATDAAAYITAVLNGTAASARGEAIMGVLNLFSTLTSNATFGAAATAWNTKVAAAVAYTGAADAVAGSTVATAGSAFVLTTGADAPAGTANDDTISGTTVLVVAAGDASVDSSSTFTVGDSLAGAAGNDVFNLLVSGNVDGGAKALPAATGTGIETVNIRNIATPDTAGTDYVTLDAALYADVSSVNADRSTTQIAVTGLGKGDAIGMKGDGNVTNADVLYAYSTATFDQVINVSGGTTAGGITATASTGVTKATVNSTGDNTVGTIKLDSAGADTVTSLTVNADNKFTGTLTAGDFASTATLTVAGAASSVSLGSAFDGATIDASGLTAGGLTIGLTTATTKLTGGAGNDVVTTAAIGATAAINAGAGSADVLDLGTNVTHLDTAAEAARYTGFDIVRVNGSYNATTLAGITGIQLSGATNSITGLDATQAANVTARANIGATTFALTNSSGTSDVLSLKMGTGTTTGAATTAGALTINGFETLNVTTNQGPTATVGNKKATIASFTADKLTAINLSGASVDITNVATTKAVTIDGSALTGDGTTVKGLIVAGSAVAGSTITGSAVRDDLTIDAEGSTYNGGAGNDLFITTTEIATADGTTDAVLNGGDGTDTLQLTTFSAVTDVVFTNVTNFEKLTLDTVAGATTAVSATLGSAARTAFADGVTVTSGTLADAATYTFASGLYNKAVNLTLVSSGNGSAAADNVTITTGAGNDVISVTATSWVGGASNGTISITTGAGDDSITLSTGTLANANDANGVVITGGTGKDVYDITHTNGDGAAGKTAYAVFTFAAGDSNVNAYDEITGFDIATAALASDVLNLAGTPTLAAYTATAATGFTAAELTVAVSAAGLVTFAGTSATSLTLAQKIAAVQSVVITTSGDTALFTDGSDSYVFQNVTAGDILVRLVGVSGTALTTTLTDDVAGEIAIS